MCASHAKQQTPELCLAQDKILWLSIYDHMSTHMCLRQGWKIQWDPMPPQRKTKKPTRSGSMGSAAGCPSRLPCTLG
eukprot:CAMPEP_0181494826 /NCGR_PEP_ID=MMETSP1110-20121109/52022_1 /TAXON_ID=174948 /ORGANISM="Symbiodinium sp., Strain CCMP421" /LENGTH=76 /DNA_ID=CAMNT_0023622351 /DNA_START=29 /DNA_END=256 /DNA_ORIENTATION=+